MKVSLVYHEHLSKKKKDICFINKVYIFFLLHLTKLSWIYLIYWKVFTVFWLRFLLSQKVFPVSTASLILDYSVFNQGHARAWNLYFKVQ